MRGSLLNCLAVASLFLGCGLDSLMAQEPELAVEDVIVETTWPEGRTPRLGDEVVFVDRDSQRRGG